MLCDGCRGDLCARACSGFQTQNRERSDANLPHISGKRIVLPRELLSGHFLDSLNIKDLKDALQLLSTPVITLCLEVKTVSVLYPLFKGRIRRYHSMAYQISWILSFLKVTKDMSAPEYPELPTQARFPLHFQKPGALQGRPLAVARPVFPGIFSVYCRQLLLFRLPLVSFCYLL